MFLFSTCAAARPNVSSHTSELTAAPVSVADFGALGDGTTDDRAAFQSALDSGSREVVIPDGTYALGAALNQWWSLHVPTGVWLHGTSRDGVILLQAASARSAARILYADGDGSEISNLTLDGQRSLQTVDEHRAGVFGAGTGLVVHHVVARNFTGDGFVVYGASGSRWQNLQALDNGRNGLTIDLTVDDVTIEDSTFRGNAVQQVDSEPKDPSVESHVRIARNVIDGGAGGFGYAMTLVGASMTNPSRSWRVIDNTITGGVQIAWISDVLFSGNVVNAGGNRSPITVLRWTKDVVIGGNALTYDSAVDWNAGIYVAGTSSAGQQSTGLTIVANTITNLHAKGYGLRIDGASDVMVSRNTISGPGTAAQFAAGIRMRATNTVTDFVRATIADNTIRDFGDAALMIQGTIIGGVTARIDALDLQRNTYANVLGTAMSKGAALDYDGTHALQRLYSRDNASMAGVTTPMTGAPVNSDYGGL